MVLVVVRDLDFVGISSLPAETDPVLMVYPHAVLARPGTVQDLKSVTRRNSEFSQIPYPVELVKLPPSHRPGFQRADSTRAAGVSAVEDVLSPPISERAYHGLRYSGYRVGRQPLLPTQRSASTAASLASRRLHALVRHSGVNSGISYDRLRP